MSALHLNPPPHWQSVLSVNPDADLPLPYEIGLPAKFTHWRAQQTDAINRVLTSEKRFIVICMPTGGGKSLAAVAAAILSGRRAAILTSTKGLQDQVSGDFSDTVSDIRGMGNYACPIAGQLGLPQSTMVTDAPCQCGYRCRLQFGGGCHYFDAYRVAQRAGIVVTNYQCWMYDGLKQSEEKGNLQVGVDPESDQPIQMLIMDEVHSAAEEIGRYIGIDLTRKECLHLHLSWPDSGGTVENWCDWAKILLEPVADRAKSIESRVRSSGGGQWSRELKHLRDMKRKLERLSAMRAEDEWIVSESDVNSESRTMSAVRFDPLSPARYAESALFRGIEKIVLVSATVRPKTATMLGIDPADMEFIEYPSTFPVERRRVIHVPSIRMTYRNEQDDDLMSEWLQVFDEICGPRLALGWKGIAHCVSYRRARFIADNSRHKSHMLIHGTFNRAAVIEQFKRRTDACMLLSPSVDTGYDFLGDLCRFQIIAKIPFSSVTDPVVKARKQRDPDYDLYQAAQTLIQASGRATRSESDWSTTFIIDDSLAWALPQMKRKGFLAKWWLESFESLDTAPEPVQFE
jgi:ATP-dependent DNA helicase DinG